MNVSGIVLEHRRRKPRGTSISTTDLMKKTAMKSPGMLLAAYVKVRMNPSREKTKSWGSEFETALRMRVNRTPSWVDHHETTSVSNRTRQSLVHSQ